MEECAICFELLKEDIGILSCGHKYHFTCLTEWMNTKNDYVNFCPQCPDTPNEIVNVILTKTDNFYPKKTKINQNVNKKNKSCCIQ